MAELPSKRETRSGQGLRANLHLLLASVGLTVVAGELVARSLLPAPLPWRYPQVRFRADPDLGFALRPDQEAFTADKSVRINARGLRGEVVPYERAPGRLRVLLLGDSIAFGYGVRENEALGSRLEALLAERGIRAEIINGSIPAYNIEQQIAYLDREGVRYAPDWVIVGVCWNDLNDKSRVGVDADGRLISLPEGSIGPGDRLAELPAGFAVRNLLKESRLAYALLQGSRILLAKYSPTSQALFRRDVLEGRGAPRVTEGWLRVEKSLQRLRDIQQNGRFRPLLVAFPIPVMLAKPYPHSSYPDRLLEMARRVSVPAIDLEDRFRTAFEGHESLFLPYDGDHPNEAGHELAAREILTVLADDRSGEGNQ